MEEKSMPKARKRSNIRSSDTGSIVVQPGKSQSRPLIAARLTLLRASAKVLHGQAKCNLSIPCVLNEKIQCRDFALPLKAIKAVEQVTCPNSRRNIVTEDAQSFVKTSERRASLTCRKIVGTGSVPRLSEQVQPPSRQLTRYNILAQSWTKLLFLAITEDNQRYRCRERCKTSGRRCRGSINTMANRRVSPVWYLGPWKRIAP
ncbi:hypothetical protein G5I_09894 [Acromyrmex echinatior]|uniref:Uncharacterized protein n=1 Tax=Acromyrmex echinatior TaxID=103372 RepID=F4WVF6_ACREC|nr:hypothetical protein G5I_09894 [Acromyrmex echinatior]